MPVEVTDRTLTDDERLRVWIYIHRQRKEWDAREKEMVAYRLVELIGRASAANILGITVRELDKLVEVFELSERFTNLRDRGAAITWARELNGLSKKLLTPSVVDAVVEQGQPASASPTRRTCASCAPSSSIPWPRRTSCHRRVTSRRRCCVSPRRSQRNEPDFVVNLDATVDAVKQLPWATVEKLKGDPEILKKLEDAEALLHALRDTLGPKDKG